MRVEIPNDRSLSLRPGASPISMRAIAAQGEQGPQGLPGVGSAAWTPSTAVTTDSVRQHADGSWIKSLASRTTRATFDATEQTFWVTTIAAPGTLEADAVSATIGDFLTAPVADTTGATDATATIQAFLNAGGGFLPPGTYLCDALHIPAGGANFAGVPGKTIIKARSTNAGPMIDTPVSTTLRNGSITGITFDCDGKAETGIYLRKVGNYSLRDNTILNNTSHPVILGDPAASSVSFGMVITSLTVDRTFGTAAPVGSRGIWVRNCTDGAVSEAAIVGCDVGVRVDCGNWKFSQVHVWGYAAGPPSVCFDDNVDGTQWTDCVGDTPTTYSFRFRKYRPVVKGGKSYQNSIYGVDNTATAIYFDMAAPEAHISGHAIEGADSSHRFAKDYDGASGWDTTTFVSTYPLPQNVATSSVLTSRFSSRFRVQLTDSNAFTLRNAAGTQFLGMNTAIGSERFQYANGLDLWGYSDNFVTKRWEVVGARGEVISRHPLAPTGALVETLPRNGGISSNSPLTSGTLFLTAIPLARGMVINNITFVSGNTGATTPTNWWFGLFDSSRVLLARSADQTTTAWTNNVAKTLAIAQTASGAASSYTIPAGGTSGLYYLGIMVAASTAPTLMAGVPGTTVPGLSPVLYGNSTTGMTTPPSFPTTAGSITGVNAAPYAYVS